jgi:hypothetical protein
MPKTTPKPTKRRGFDLGGRSFEEALTVALNTPLPPGERRKRRTKRPTRTATKPEEE